MSKQIKGNDLRMHRRRCFLSQKELGRAVGYKDAVQVGRHEQSLTVPPFLIAFAYEAVFQLPASAIFGGFSSAAAIAVESNLTELKRELQRQVDSGRASKITVQKLKWLTSRRPVSVTA